MSLAALRQRDRDITPTLHDWVQQPDLSARLVHIGEQYVHGTHRPDTDSLVLETETVKSTSSMAPALIHQSNASTYSPPSLHSCCTEATPTETSISTGLAGHLGGGYPLLEEGHEGVLEIPQGHARTPVYECAFWFLDCAYISRNQEEWERHCLSHFRGEEPPLKVQCPLCDWTAHACEGGGHVAWATRMHHVASEHVMYGQTLRTSRPDFALFEYLWQRRLIDAEDLKELKAGNHNLTRPPTNFVETGGGRRERGGRPHRTQHVRATRQPSSRQP